MATPAPPLKFRAPGSDGLALVGGLLYTYAAGTTTPKSSYTTPAGDVANTNPIVLDARGECNLWLDGAYKFELRTALGVLIWTIDNVTDIAALVAASTGTLRTELANTADPAKGAGLTGYGGSTNYAAGTVGDKLQERMSVIDKGADPTGISDSTAAFNSVITAGRRGFMPAGIYSISDVGVLDNFDFEGEGRGITTIRVRTNNTAAFRNAVAAVGVRQNFRLAHCTIEAGPGVLGAKAFRQDNKNAYTAYAVFENVETNKNLALSYDGFFIFTTWNNCRDGYVGTVPTGQQHYAVSSRPLSTAQAFQTNICTMRNCQIFGATSGAPAAVDIEYGSNWHFPGTDFEGMTTLAVRAQGVFNGGFSEGAWFENVVSASGAIVQLIECPGPNAQACSAWGFDGVMVVPLDNPLVTKFVDAALSTTHSFERCTFLRVPAGMALTTQPTQIRGEMTTNRAISGAGAAGLLPSVAPSLSNVLHVGPVGVPIASWTNSNFVALANVASGVGMSETACRFTLNSTDGAAYLTIPTKIVEYLRGKAVTWMFTAYGDATGGAEFYNGAIWDSIALPIKGNATAVSFLSPGTVSNAGLHTCFVNAVVGASASTLHVGITAGGNAPNKLVTIESMRVLVGYVMPTAAGLRGV